MSIFQYWLLFYNKLNIYINATGPNSKGGYFTYITSLIRSLSIIDKVNNYFIVSNGEIYNSIKYINGNFNIIKLSDI